MLLVEGTVAIYSKLQMFSIGGHLFRPEDFLTFLSFQNGQCIFSLMLNAMSVSVYGKMMHKQPYICITMHSTGQSEVGVAMRMVELPSFTSKLRIIQRAVRRYYRLKREAISLAVAMASHSRLGAHSGLRSLDGDLLRLCVC